MKRTLKKVGASLGTVLLGAPLLALAQVQPPRVYTTVGQFQNLFCLVINWLFTFFVLIAIIFFIWAAYVYLTSGGDSEKVKRASNVFIYAVVAIIIALIARGVPLIVGSFIGTGTGTGAFAC
jgi:fumarate reductase subunit D